MVAVAVVVAVHFLDLSQLGLGRGGGGDGGDRNTVTTTTTGISQRSAEPEIKCRKVVLVFVRLTYRYYRNKCTKKHQEYLPCFPF